MSNIIAFDSDFAKKEKARFRARKSHWIRQGFDPEAAAKMARKSASASRKKAQVEVDQCGVKDKLNSEHIESIAQVESGGVEQAQAEVGQVETVNDISFLSFFDPSKILSTLSLILYASIVVAASSILISSSLTVFGNSWDGWIKAALLEIGIVALYCLPSKSRFEWILTKGGFIFLLILSFVVLHSGVETQRENSLIKIEAGDKSVQSLESLESELKTSLSNLPVNHTTKRQILIDQLADLTKRLEAKRSEVKLSGIGISSVQAISNSEKLIRAALLLLNLVFSHKIIEILGKRRISASGRVAPSL